MKRVAIYIRVSTQEQASGGYSISEQTERLKKYCEAHDWPIAAIYTDPGFSGANTDRPALQNLFRDAAARNFNTVLVYKLDRLSRSQKDTMHIIEDVFLKNGIDFISMNENFDTSTPFGRAMIGILSVFAQLERDQIKERMTMGRIGRAKTGKWSGSSRAPVGYDYKDGELIINEYEAMQVRMVFDLFLNGLDGKPMSMHAIRMYMKEHYSTRYSNWNNESSVGRMLRDPIYIGKIIFAKKVYDGTHDPIISQEMFDAVQAKYNTYMETFALAGNRTSYFERTSLLSGIIFCGECGARYYSLSKVYNLKSGEKVRYYYYRCYSRGGRKEMRKSDNCKNKNYKSTELNEIVIRQICGLAADPEGIRALIGRTSVPQIDTKVIQKKIDQIEDQVSRLLDLYQLGNINLSSVQARIEKLTEEKKRLEAKSNGIKEHEPELNMDRAIEILKTASSVFQNGDLVEQQNLIRSLIKKIIIYPDNVEIHWLFCE